LFLFDTSFRPPCSIKCRQLESSPETGKTELVEAAEGEERLGNSNLARPRRDDPSIFPTAYNQYTKTDIKERV
jgi:hypothetical protein